MDQLVVEWVVHLGAQPVHVNIHYIGPAVEIDVPDLLGDQRSRDEAIASVVHQTTLWVN